MDGSSTNVRRLLAIAAVLAAVVWAVSWGFNGQTADGTRRVLGLTEGGWRLLLNPAIGLALVGAVVWARPQIRPGAAMIVGGLAAMLAGNVLEFGLLGRATPFGDAGSLLLMAGTATALVGLAWTMGSSASRASGRTLVGIGAGIGVGAAAALMSAAVPAAAGMLVLLLADALWESTSPRAMRMGSALAHA